MSILTRSRKSLALASLLTLLVSGCGGGGGGGGGFAITGVNLPPGFAGWKINRPIRISFSSEVDPGSVTNNTINVRLVNGAPAFGTPSVDPADPKTVIWRPLCPTLDDLSDAGLLSGPDPSNMGAPYQYELNIIGSDQNAGFTVRSVGGNSLALSDTRLFTTPTSSQFSELFVDDAVGPPTPVVRSAGSAEQNATYVLVNGTKHFFERQPGSGAVLLNPPLDLPLNLLSNQSSQVELYVQFNQSVDMRSSNISPQRLQWEFETTPGSWQAITMSLELDSNCTESGSVVRFLPSGLLPPSALADDTNMRVVVTTEFRDIIGEQNLLVQDQFAPTTTEVGLPPLVDNYLEEFDDQQNADLTAPFAEPQAEWGDGELVAKFSFPGTGGPGGDFDWEVGTGEILIFNSVSATLFGGPGFTKQKIQQSINGVIDVRDLQILAGGILKCEGPNPVTILASGNITIDGLIDISGTNSPGVNTLNTTTVPEPGAPGQCGGGRGGVGSPLTTASSPKGGNGHGAFNAVDGGGVGGDTGWSTGSQVNKRRGGGGGGGRLGVDVLDPSPKPNGPPGGVFWQTRIGLDAEPGFENLVADNGSSTGAGPAKGGPVGPSPFLDGDPTNDFFGTMFDTVNDRLIFGELKQPWAGAGGGAGGDAAKVKKGQTFPSTPFGKGGDEKGAGGGGGGGSLKILALGRIQFGPSGKIQCRGGTGGGGENTIFLNRVGGGSGAGSGGHVILQSATLIDFSNAIGISINATGGQGGAGLDDRGGAVLSNAGMKETVPQKDACPPAQFQFSSDVCLGHVEGAGGDGSPGIIQLHTTTGTIGQDILLPAGLTLRDVSFPPPLCDQGSATCYMIPAFGRHSRSRSDWIALGDGGWDAEKGMYRDMTFDWGGTDVLTGLVETDGSGRVKPQPFVLAMQNALANGYTFVFDDASALPQKYRDNTELLRHFLLELKDSSQATNFMRFDVVSAAYDANTNPDRLILTLDANGPPLETFQSSSTTDAELQPAYFRIATDTVPDSLPPTATVQIQFAATTADFFGLPDESYGLGGDEPLVNTTPDFTALNFAGNSQLRFIRFEILFDINALQGNLTPSSPIPAATHLRQSFQWDPLP